jgi:hypothetical protein
METNNNDKNSLLVELTPELKAFLIWKKNKHGFNSMAETIRDYLRNDPEQIEYASE